MKAKKRHTEKEKREYRKLLRITELTNKLRCFLLIALLIVAPVFGGMDILVANATEPGSITMVYPVGGASFSLYMIGESDHNDGYDLFEDFNGYQVNLRESGAAATLADYIKRDNVEPMASTFSQEDGIVSFTGLNPGVYLITGERTEAADGTIYTALPCMLEIPQRTGETLNYQVEIDAKYDTEITKELTVLKLWQGDDQNNRPEKIVVQLLRDGEPVREAELNQACGWTKTWKKLSADHEWTIVEKEVPAGYVVEKEQNGTTITIINSKPDTPHYPPENPPDNPPDTPPNTPPNNPPSRIPQTGQEWWQIMAYMSGGLFLILVGLILRREPEYDED